MVLINNFWKNTSYVLCYLSNNTSVVLRRTRHAMYIKHNIEAHSCNHCCHGKEIGITYSECVSEALVTKHERCMPYIARLFIIPLHISWNQYILMAERNVTSNLQMETETLHLYFFIPCKCPVCVSLWHGTQQAANQLQSIPAVSDQALIRWPPRSLDLMPCHFLYRGMLRILVFLLPLPQDLPELPRQITAAI